MKNSSEIQKDVYEELKWDSRITEGDIGVSVMNNVVTLNGTIPNYAEKWAAEEAAQRVSGVTAVVNHVEVSLPGTKTIDDQEIAQAATHGLKWNVWVPVDKVMVVVEKGWITLSGTVESEHQKRAAESGLRFLQGVRGVTNEIVVKPAIVQKDIQAQIKRALHRHAEEEANKINISVSDGDVHLSGRVHSWNERSEAELAAWCTPGVRSVKNNVSISS